MPVAQPPLARTCSDVGHASFRYLAVNPSLVFQESVFGLEDVNWGENVEDVHSVQVEITRYQLFKG